MRSLLDSHAFLGWLEGSDNISEAARSVLRIRESEIFVSLACVRESTLKTVLEKWASRGPFHREEDPRHFRR